MGTFLQNVAIASLLLATGKHVADECFPDEMSGFRDRLSDWRHRKIKQFVDWLNSVS
jgi:hypothetical protein